MARKPTLRDVANAANVSEMTVSRALRHGTEVSEKTRGRIAGIATKLGYVPNRIAGALASRSVNLVGVVVPSLSSHVFPEVLSGLTDGLAGSPMQPVIGVSGYDLVTEEGVIREMLSWRPAGLVVAGLEHSDTARKMMANAGIPVVEIMDTDGTPIEYCVGISHLKAGRLMAADILNRGYRNIGFIGTKLQHDFRAQKRLRGFTETLTESGVSLAGQALYSQASSIAKGREMTASLLATTPDLQCIYYSSDVMAIGGLMHCLASGLSIPGDLALAGFNNLELLNGLPIRLATTNSFRSEIGRKAAELILTAAGGGSMPPDKITQFQPIVEIGDSL
ncbi:MAG TPA: LacI family transcriptional regulator [Rhodobacteraceae bacterium]|jgi:LacI family transcriptional regulator, gluconate utilization system Gnt-I transcriptional repressor|nr:LacI family transcriptional regulator [Paracoccaceae bacterium]